MSLYGAVEGVGSGKKIVFGTVTPTSANTSVELGNRLASIDAVIVGLQNPPTLTHMWSSAGFSGTTVTILNRKPVGSGDVTPANATTPFSPVFYIAIGDAPK